MEAKHEELIRATWRAREEPDFECVMRAARLLPKSEVVFLREAVPANEQLNMPDIQVAAMLVHNRLSNRICDHCESKRKLDMLKLCPKCKMTWYCSVKCWRAASESHAKWCCQPEAPRDMGPMRSVLIKTVKTDVPGVLKADPSVKNPVA